MTTEEINTFIETMPEYGRIRRSLDRRSGQRCIR